jgi:putative DNA primase/helicase
MQSEENLLHPDVVFHEGRVCKWEKTEGGAIKYKAVADFIDVIKVTENLETQEMQIEIKYSDSTSSSGIKKLTAGLDEIATKAKLLNLAVKGLDVNENNAGNVIKHLRNRRDGAEKTMTHSHLGFFLKDEEYFFKTYMIVGKSKDIDINSEYAGNHKDIKPKGKSKEWLAVVENAVLGTIPLELALAIGFSAPIVGLIAKDIGIESLFFHMFGESTQGKSTAAMLAVSAFGSPNISESGLMMTWNGTTNGIQGILKNNNGMPIVFDEASTANKNDFTREIYALTAGKEKLRMDKECKIREQGSWNTTIISTGELSLFSKSKENTGLRMRLFEFGNIVWTDSAEQSELIKKTILSNHGQYGRVFIRKLLGLGKENVLETYESCKSSIKDKMVKSEFTDRIAGKLAILTTTAILLRDQLKIELNVEEIEKLIVENERENLEDKDIAGKALDKLIQLIAQNEQKFEKFDWNAKDKNTFACDRMVWGRIELKSKMRIREMKVIMIADIFNKELKELGFDEPKIVLKKWKEKGILDCEDGKLTRRRKIGDIDKVTCYVIKIPEDQVGIEIEINGKSNQNDAEKEPAKMQEEKGSIPLIDEEGEVPYKKFRKGDGSKQEKSKRESKKL